MRTANRAVTSASGALAGALCLCLLALALALPRYSQAALSPSAYRVGSLCPAPAPGYSGCLGLRLVAKRPHSLRGSRSSRLAKGPALEQVEFTEPWAGSLSPQNLLSAYGLSGTPAPATRQTLALVDAFNDPTAEHDLEVFDGQYGLPACTTANGCFSKVELRGGAHNTLPPTDAGWAQEIATDVEVAHGVCGSCRILLVEAHSNSNADLEAAEEKAVQLGANEISNSWGGPERGVSVQEDNGNAFNHPGVVITAASGDNGYLDWGLEEESERGFADYPASSPHVVAVGGTHLSRTAGGAWKEETVWNGNGAGGGGCSIVLAAPVWQQSLSDWSAVGCGAHRAVADVSADADPYTGVAVYDSTPVREGELEYRGWVPIGGTSVASPIIASTFALAGGAGTGSGGQPVAYPAQTLYENSATEPTALHDVTFGSNGACANGFDESTGASNCTLGEEAASCSATAICLARSGYDGPSGVGTPHGIAAFESAGEAARIEQLEEPVEAEERAREARAAERAREAATGGVPPNNTPGFTGTGGGPLSGAALEAPSLGPSAPILSAPALTKTATVALSRGRPRVSRVAFVFTLNVPALVRVTLAKLVVAHGRARWRTLPFSRAIAGRAGRNRSRLSGPGTLAPGRYRLTLAPSGGRARALTVLVG